MDHKLNLVHKNCVWLFALFLPLKLILVSCSVSFWYNMANIHFVDPLLLHGTANLTGDQSKTEADKIDTHAYIGS